MERPYNPMQLARYTMDALRGRTGDPSWSMQGQPLPPQAVLDQPVPGAMPAQEQDNAGAVDPLNRATSLRGLIEQRMREQEEAARMAQ